MRVPASLLVVGLAGMACSVETPDPGSVASSTSAATTAATESGVPSGSPSAPRRPAVSPADLDVAVAWTSVRRLAGKIGPREATSPAYARAAAWVVTRFRAQGYDVRRHRLRVPAGVSWGVPVDAGTTVNVVASPPGFDAGRPHLVVGAHLDTVPQAPGAEDNASGVGVLLAAAEAAARGRTRLPVVFVAFAAEEPRGPTDDNHRYGSRAYVASLGRAERRAVRGMLALDRVGVGRVVPVCSATQGADRGRADALRAGARAGVATVACTNRSSDHWSFVRAGLPGVRVGGTSYAGYHSPQDVPSVVDRDQLRRSGRLVLAWLAPR